MILVWFDEVDFLKCSRSASQLSFTNLFHYEIEIMLVVAIWTELMKL